MNRILGENIARLRKEKGLTQEELAKELNISYQAVSKWENGISSPDISNIKLIAQLFGVSIDALFGMELFPEKPADTASFEMIDPDPLKADSYREEISKRNGVCEGDEYLPWEDDGTLRAVLFKGRHLLSVDEIKRGNIQFTYTGEALNIFSFFDVVCDNVLGNVDAGGDVTCDDVAGSVNASGDVECEDVGGSINCGGDVDCGDVGGYVRAGGDVDCGDVSGDVNASGDIDCGIVGGNVTAGGDVDCGDVEGSVIHS